MQGDLDLLTIDPDIMTFTLNILSGPLLSLEIIHGNSFLFSGHINLTWNFCILCYFDLWLWNYDLHLEMLSRPLLENYKWQMHHIFRAWKPTWYLYTVGLCWCFDISVSEKLWPVIWLSNLASNACLANQRGIQCQHYICIQHDCPLCKWFKIGIIYVFT